MERLFNILFISVLLVSCTSGRKYFPTQIEEVEVPIVRFDKDLQNVQPMTVRQDIEVLYEQYPYFMPVFVENVLGLPTFDTAYLCEVLPQFLEDTIYGFKQTNQREREYFADIHAIQKDINMAFSRIHYLYPDWEIPTIYFFISGFNASIFFPDDESIAVGTDMYLGSDYEYYNRVVYEYQKRTMRKECIPVDVTSAWLFRHIPYTSTENRLIDQMLYRGKVMYLISRIFQQMPGYEVMGYSPEQWKWCEKYEKNIWTMMMDKKDLFKTENMVLTSYLNDGPFTAEISQEAPARLGTWMGWRIIESYMNHHPEISLQQLMENGNSQEILEESYYRI